MMTISLNSHARKEEKREEVKGEYGRIWGDERDETWNIFLKNIVAKTNSGLKRKKSFIAKKNHGKQKLYNESI